MLSGQVVIAEATWEFNGADAEIAPRLRTAAGWVPEVGVEAGRTPQLRDVVFLPLTAIGDGGIPEERSTAEALSGGVESMLAYDELLARSALAGVQFPREYGGVRAHRPSECNRDHRGIGRVGLLRSKRCRTSGSIWSQPITRRKAPA